MMSSLIWALVGDNQMSLRDQVRSLIEFEPTLSNAEMARALGCSRQNVSYHARRLALPRQISHRNCRGECGRRISKRLKSGMCRPCWLASYAYEFVCGRCGNINVVYGRQATSRRRNDKRAGSRQRNYCDSSCASKHNQGIYWALRKLDSGVAQRL